MKRRAFALIVIWGMVFCSGCRTATAGDLYDNENIPCDTGSFTTPVFTAVTEDGNQLFRFWFQNSSSHGAVVTLYRHTWLGDTALSTFTVSGSSSQWKEYNISFQTGKISLYLAVESVDGEAVTGHLRCVQSATSLASLAIES